MPSKLFLRGDSEEIWLDHPADWIVEAVSLARIHAPGEFLRLEQVPYRPDEPSRPLYVDPAAVAAVVPLDPRELQASYADLPDWLEQS